MNLLSLHAIFNTAFELIEMTVENPTYFQTGDFISINDGPVCTIAVSSDDGADRKESEAHFLSEEYRSLYRKRTICRIREIDGNRFVIEMLGKPRQCFDDVIFPGGMNIAVDDNVLRGKSIESFADQFYENYQVELDGNEYFIFGENVYANEDVDDFIIVDAARKKYLQVKKKYVSELTNDAKDMSGGKALVICGAERQLCNFDNWTFSLHNVKIHIIDKTEKGRLSETAQRIFKQGGDRYVRLWKQYTEAENDMVDAWLKEAGKLSYTGNQAENEHVYRFKLKDNVVNQKSDFKRIVSEHFDNRVKLCSVNSVSFASGEIDESRDNDKGSVTVRVDKYIEDREGLILPDETGSRKMYERRMQAINAILSTDSANKYVAMLITGEYVPKSAQNQRWRLDEDVIEEIFGKRGANEQQREAIECAINTPDIAIIQGPPGTGKTRVIRAILAHLQKCEKKETVNEKTKGAAHLLTAYQREATKNIVGEEDTDRLGFPIFTYTKNAKAGETDENQRRLEKWCEKCREKVNHFQEQEKSIRRRRFADRLKYYCTNLKEPRRLDEVENQLASVYEFLKNEQAEDGETFNRYIQEAKDKAETLWNEYRVCGGRARKEGLLKYIADLPTSLQEIEDKPNSLLFFTAASKDEWFRTNMKEHIEALIAIVNKDHLTNEDCRAIARIKVKMAMCYPLLNKTTKEDNKKIKKCLQEIIGLLEKERLTQKQEILNDYIEEMEPTEELKNSIKRYREIDAATHQKTMAYELNGTGGLPSYKNVLVDEAARSCPADLMIPIACARDRIILVGDEKQLPYFINEHTLSWLKKRLDDKNAAIMYAELKGKEVDKSAFSVSMFEYLISMAEKIKQRDPDQRQRVVKLKHQYRMPPVLGKFVSEMFYDGKLINGNPDPKAFKQDYPLIGGLNMVWVSVPASLNREERKDKGSICRQAEVRVVMELLRKIGGKVLEEIHQTGAQNKGDEKIGIITAYSAQRDLLENSLNEEAGKNSMFDQLRQYIQIGTVDSFQGKEFDIVILSFVRTSGYGFWSIKEKMGEWEIPRSGRQRTCVAFSRAKKCMIVVGDKSMFTGRRQDEAEENVPSIVEFYKRCEAETDGVCKVLDEKEVIG